MFYRKLPGWKGFTLSQARKVMLIKSTLQNLPTYALNLFSIHSKVAKHLEAIQRNSTWPKTNKNKKYPLMAWENICRPKTKGGLEVRKLKQVNSTLQEKKI